MGRKAMISSGLGMLTTVRGSLCKKVANLLKAEIWMVEELPKTTKETHVFSGVAMGSKFCLVPFLGWLPSGRESFLWSFHFLQRDSILGMTIFERLPSQIMTNSLSRS